MDLTEGNIKNHIWTLALPVTIGFFFNTMFNVVDTYFAGQISIEALAAMSLTFPIFFIILAFSQGISAGCSAILSNAIGAKQTYEIKKYSAQIISYGIFSSLLLTCIGLLFSRPLLLFLGASGNYLNLALDYIHIIYLGSFFFLLTSSANSILLSHGNSKTMRNVLITSFIINCILDPWFLFGGFGIPAMGLKGIALATVIGMVYSASYTLIKVIKEHYLKEVKFSDFIPNFHIFTAITKQSFPSAINMMSMALGIFVVTYYVNQFGSDYTAAYGASMRIQQIFILPSIGIHVACLMIVGQNNGAGDFSRIKETIKLCLKYGNLIVLLGSIILFLFPQFFLEPFIENRNVLNEGIIYLRFAAFANWGYMIMTIYTSVLQGIKRPNILLYLGIIRQFILPIIFFYITIDILHLGIYTLWISMLITVWLSTAFTIFYTDYLLKIEKERMKTI